MSVNPTDHLNNPSHSALHNITGNLSLAPEDLSAQCNGILLVFVTARDINSIIFCSLNGTHLLEGKDVSKTGTKEITLTLAPASGEELFLKYI